MQEYNYTRYLASKKSVDDRALNRHVWSKLVKSLSGTRHGRPLRILELGAGIGTMVERVVDWGLISGAEYTAIDISKENINEARHRLSMWATDKDLPMTWRRDEIAVIQTEKADFSISLKIMDVYDFFLKEKPVNHWDLLIAHAFMDLINVDELLPKFCAVLKSGGILYLSLNYDGETIFLPTLETHLDEHIIGLYHQSMDARVIHGKRSGNSKAGRYLFDRLGAVGAEVLAVGSSDWIVHPKRGKYPEDEKYFLHFIVHTLYQELKQNPLLDSPSFHNWMQKRHAQIENGELIYIAKQLDFLARVPTPTDSALVRCAANTKETLS